MHAGHLSCPAPLDGHLSLSFKQHNCAWSTVSVCWQLAHILSPSFGWRNCIWSSDSANCLACVFSLSLKHLKCAVHIASSYCLACAHSKKWDRQTIRPVTDRQTGRETDRNKPPGYVPIYVYNNQSISYLEAGENGHITIICKWDGCRRITRTVLVKNWSGITVARVDATLLKSLPQYSQESGPLAKPLKRSWQR